MSHSIPTCILTIWIVFHILCVATARITQLGVYVHEWIHIFPTLTSGSFDQNFSKKKVESHSGKMDIMPYFWYTGGGDVVAKSCLTLKTPWTGARPGSSVHGISQVRILEWAAISFCRGSSPPRDRTHVSCIASGFFTATREAHFWYILCYQLHK